MFILTLDGVIYEHVPWRRWTGVKMTHVPHGSRCQIQWTLCLMTARYAAAWGARLGTWQPGQDSLDDETACAAW